MFDRIFSLYFCFSWLRGREAYPPRLGGGGGGGVVWWLGMREREVFLFSFFFFLVGVFLYVSERDTDRDSGQLFLQHRQHSSLPVSLKVYVMPLLA